MPLIWKDMQFNLKVWKQYSSDAYVWKTFDWTIQQFVLDKKEIRAMNQLNSLR